MSGKGVAAQKRKMDGQAQHYAGEEPCTGVTAKGEVCSQRARFLLNGALKCGRHAPKGSKRTVLEMNPNAAAQREQELRAHAASVREAQEINNAEDERGHVIVRQLRMGQPSELVTGYLLVFPNNKHGNRADGYGCEALSPMRLGPVQHGEPGVPTALNIENYHQAAKVFSHELEDDGTTVKAAFFELRDKLYQDAKAHRHKPGAIGVPEFSVHLDAYAGERRYAYVESRYFYCHWYERLAKATAECAHLRAQLQRGVNLCITGYDGRPVSEQGIEAEYLDAGKPFGHEMVLYCLLTIADPAQYPWNRYYEGHKDLYDPLPFNPQVA